MNKESKRAANQRYYAKNAERLKKKSSEYKKENKDEKKVSDKKYYDKTKKKVVCLCGAEILEKSMKRHLETKKHNDRVVGGGLHMPEGNSTSDIEYESE
jgi:hypothetical protein